MLYTHPILPLLAIHFWTHMFFVVIGAQIFRSAYGSLWFIVMWLSIIQNAWTQINTLTRWHNLYPLCFLVKQNLFQPRETLSCSCNVHRHAIGISLVKHFWFCTSLELRENIVPPPTKISNPSVQEMSSFQFVLATCIALTLVFCCAKVRLWNFWHDPLFSFLKACSPRVYFYLLWFDCISHPWLAIWNCGIFLGWLFYTTIFAGVLQVTNLSCN